MDQGSVINMIACVRQVNGMLQILDAEKNNSSITLGELQARFLSQYKLHPASDEFAFYNQNQFLTSLLAYLCMPSEKFYDELPEDSVELLSLGWGTQGMHFNGSLKSLVRHLRNSISHGHITVTPELIFEFKNRELFIIFNHVSLHKFCQALAYWCITKDVTLSGLSGELV